MVSKKVFLIIDKISGYAKTKTNSLTFLSLFLITEKVVEASTFI